MSFGDPLFIVLWHLRKHWLLQKQKVSLIPITVSILWYKIKQRKLKWYGEELGWKKMGQEGYNFQLFLWNYGSLGLPLWKKQMI